VQKSELLALLNAEASILGSKPVTERQLEDWISEDLLDGPKPKGKRRGVNPDWLYASGTAERALKVIRLRSLGTRRFTAQRIQLWLGDYELDKSQIKNDLSAEFKRLIKHHFFRKPWKYDARTRKFMSNVEVQKCIQKIGKVDSRLIEAGFVPSNQAILEFGSEFIWGPTSADNLLKSLKAQILTIVPWFSKEFVDNIFSDLQPYVQVSGLFGNPDEIEKSGIAELTMVEGLDLENGRRFFQILLGLFELASKILSLPEATQWKEGNDAIRAIVVTLKEQQEWSIVFFAMGTLAAYRRRIAANEHGQKSEDPNIC
jgi:hypothetical protein